MVNLGGNLYIEDDDYKVISFLGKNRVDPRNKNPGYAAHAQYSSRNGWTRHRTVPLIAVRAVQTAE